MKLTAAEVRALRLKDGATEAIVFDGDVPGFGIRLRASGAKTFVFQYKLGAKQRRVSLGPVSASDIIKVRETAKTLYAAVRLGRDPAGEKQRARLKAAETFEAVAAHYLRHQETRLRPRSYAQVQRHLNLYAKPLHRHQLGLVTRRDIAACVAAVRTSSGLVTGNRTRATLSAFFSWAMAEGLAETNPVIGTNRSEERPRERVLDTNELRLIWNALAEDDFGSITRLLMLTGQRAGEICGLRWSEIRDDTIVLPGTRTKNHRPHTIPLSEAARDILARRPRREGRDLIFGFAAGPFNSWSYSKAELDKRIAETGGRSLPHWTVHDLRRSCATHMAEIGIQPHVVEATLNHVSGHKAGVAGVYNRSTYEAEKRTALDRWAAHLLAIVERKESNVAPLRRA
jgi:integrase